MLVKQGESFEPEWAGPGDWAAMYRAAGLQVVPSHLPSAPNWKRPALADWKSLQEEIVPQTTFDRWYGPRGEHSARSNMGVLTGRASQNVFVIDLDDYKTPSALQWWHAVLHEHNNGSEPETCQQVTGGGGRQLFFRAPAGWRTPTNKTPIGIDVRGQGGFAVLPPSLHVSGQTYQWKSGCAPWEVEIADAPDWLLQAVSDLVERYGGDQGRETPAAAETHTATPAGEFDAFGSRVDGRDHYMRDLIWASVTDWYRDCPIKPSDAEIQARMREAWSIYERKVKSRLEGPDTNAAKLEREGRGATLFADKWRRAMSKWDTDIHQAAQRPLARDEWREARQPAPSSAPADPADIFETLALADIDALPPPSWLVEGLIPETGLTFIYGKPGKGKSFVCLDLALRVAHGFDWHGKECRQGGVLYIAGEGKGGYRNRMHGWHLHHGLVADCAPFRLLPRAVNFMVPDEVAKLVRTVKASVGDAKVVVVDTVARVLPGAEENASKEMGMFVAACDAIREACGVAVIGVHHSGKDEDRGMRGSTALEGAGDAVLHLKRRDDSSLVEVVTEKQKDGEEAKPLFLRLAKVEWMDGLKQTSTLVPIEASAPENASKSSGEGWPDRDVCRQILTAVDEQWTSGRPWIFAANSSRAVVRNISKRWRLPEPVVKDMIATWVANEVIVEETKDAKNHVSGFKVLQAI